MRIKIGKRQFVKNVFYNIAAFAIQFIINFYISPLIVEKVGVSAYGFIGLANDFISYVSIIATIFNSVAARFIANSFYKEDYATANRYFNSLIITNIIISGVIGAVSLIFVPNLNKILVIPNSLLIDVKITFMLMFTTYIVSLVTNVFTVSTFIVNRSDIQGIRNVVQYFIRFACVVLLLNLVSVKIYWVALGSLIATVVIAIMNINLTSRLTPELRIDKNLAEKKSVFELARSGSWMALISISNILLRGLDLIVANLMLGDYEMGLLSVARVLPNSLTGIVNTIAPIFTPVFVMYYANENIDELSKQVKKSIKTMAALFYVPISLFIVFSYEFYGLWQNGLTYRDISVVTILSILTVIQTYFESTTATMAQISVVVNKVRLPVIINLFCGMISVVVEVLLIKYSSLGVYSIVLSTTIIMIIRYTLFNAVYAARCLNKKHLYFACDMIKTWGSIPIIVLMFYGIKRILPVYSWISLAVDSAVCFFVGFLFMIVLYTHNEILVWFRGLIKSE